MSQKLVDLSPDLRRLRDDGFDIQIVGSHLLVRDVPYVNQSKEVKRGVLVSVLTLMQDKTVKPNDHVAYFIGETPCDLLGAPLSGIINNSTTAVLTEGLTVNFRFSSKPTHNRGYVDYYEKMTTYVKILSGHARAIDPSIGAITRPIVRPDEGSTPFKYLDTASSRAGIDGFSSKLALRKLAILGVGGTGAYVLDLVTKTHVIEIHVFDDDWFAQHNAFRAPGALGIDELKPNGLDMRKVEYYQRLYSKLRTGVIAHPYRIDTSNMNELREMDFVFLCMDSGELKDPIMRTLEEALVPFIDVGMGVHRKSNGLTGILRTTTSTPDKREHIRGNHRISFAPATGDNEYSRNIQTADLNALNAALAVIKWKKLLGFYCDLEKEHHSTFVIETSKLSREDQ